MREIGDEIFVDAAVLYTYIYRERGKGEEGFNDDPKRRDSKAKETKRKATIVIIRCG